MRWFNVMLIACALFVARPANEAPCAPEPQWAGIHVVRTAPVDASIEAPAHLPAILTPHEPIFRTDRSGNPSLSAAGFVQLRPEGSGFVHRWSLSELRGSAAASARRGRDDWGDVEAFRAMAQVIDVWRKRDPARPRIVIGDISGPLGGFPDFDGDGVSDHLSHQTGLNVNVLLPPLGTTERAIELGRDGEDALDRAACRELALLLFDAGAWSITTNASTHILDDLPLEAVVLVRDDAQTVYTVGSARWNVTLRHGVGDHDDHMNAWFTCRL